jgi:predicted DNA-binding protein YlxM (UPF0122 family)
MEMKSRNQKMIGLYKEGYTLQEIGDQYGVSRERVRQIVQSKEYINGSDVRKKRAVDLYGNVSGMPKRKQIERAKTLRMSVSVVKLLRKGKRTKIEGGWGKKGQEIEEMISDLLTSQGVNNTLMPCGHPFDILTSDGKRIDVKGNYTYFSEDRVSPMYKIKIRKRMKGSFCDFFILYIAQKNDIYVIPDNAISGVDFMYISCPSVYKTYPRWEQYKNRFDLLKGQNG